MGQARKADATSDLGHITEALGGPWSDTNSPHAWDSMWSFLDVGCGRGEVLDHAEALGYLVKGTEIVEDLLDPPRIVYAEGWALPFRDNAFHVVSCLDVLEHLLPGDEVKVLAEIERVAHSWVMLTANNRPSRHNGVELHVNRRSYMDWHMLICDAFKGHEVQRIGARHYVSECWRVKLTPPADDEAEPPPAAA